MQLEREAIQEGTYAKNNITPVDDQTYRDLLRRYSEDHNNMAQTIAHLQSDFDPEAAERHSKDQARNMDNRNTT